MERPLKRIKLMIQTDPSIPPEDGSRPFLESRDVVAFAIFKTLSAHGQKNKMKMELVCKSFKSLIENRLSWEGEDYLNLGDIDTNGMILINSFEFSLEKASAALSKLLDRITVKALILYEFSNVSETIMFDLSDAIAKHKKFIKLKYIQFIGFVKEFSSTDSKNVISTIVDCGLENVEEIECGDWFFNFHIQSAPPLSFYSLIKCCPNLTMFTFLIVDLLPHWECLLPALQNCPDIKSLVIHGFDHEKNLTYQNAIDFAKFCQNTFSKLTFLHFGPTVEIFNPLEFVDALGQPLLANLIDFCIALDPEIHSHGEFLKVMCGRFPSLTSLVICGSAGFSTDIVLDAIGNIFNTYTGDASDIYEFEFSIHAENPADVIFQLVNKTWNEEDEFVEIEGKYGSWTCIKDYVRISLDLHSVEDED